MTDGEFELLIPEPTEFYSQLDEDNFYNSLQSLGSVRQVQARQLSRGKTQNEIVLSLVDRYMDAESLRSLLGLMMRYSLSMSGLREQCGPHNENWFKDPQKYWYQAVFSESTNSRD